MFETFQTCSSKLTIVIFPPVASFSSCIAWSLKYLNKNVKYKFKFCDLNLMEICSIVEHFWQKQLTYYSCGNYWFAICIKCCFKNREINSLQIYVDTRQWYFCEVFLNQYLVRKNPDNIYVIFDIVFLKISWSQIICFMKLFMTKSEEQLYRRARPYERFLHVRCLITWERWRKLWSPSYPFRWRPGYSYSGPGTSA